MRLLLVNWWFPPQDSGGVPMYNLNMVKGLQRRGYQVSVISSNKDKPVEELIDGVVRVPYPRYARAQRIPAAGRFARFGACLLYARRVYQAATKLEKRDGRFDVVEFAETNFEGLCWALRKKPYFIRSHTPWFLLDRFFEGEGRRSYSTWPIKVTDEVFYRRARAVSCPSESLRQELLKEYGRGLAVEVVPNPVDTEAFHPAPTPPGKPTLLYFGRLERAKGIDIFLDAVERLLRERDDLQVIVGGHSRDPAFGPAAIRGRFPDQDRVTLLPDVTEAMVPEVFRKASVYINPARVFESFSYTNAQAMASGVPVVTSASGGMPEVVRAGKDGTVVASYDADEWASAIGAYLSDREMRSEHGKSGRLRAQQEFSVDAVAAKLEQFYRGHITA